MTSREPNGSEGRPERNTEVQVAVRRVSAAARRLPLPTYKTPGAAGMDLLAAVDQPIRLEPGERQLIPTGIAIALPTADWAALIYARSGLASKHGICLANGVGVVDSDYRGEILCALYNGGETTFVIEPGDRIAQLILTPVAWIRWQEVDLLPATERGAAGFGSTGRGEVDARLNMG